MSARRLVECLADIRLADVFNPYADRCVAFDLPDAPGVRRRALENYLDAVRRSGTQVVWMGRDLGYRGGRRTGLALTDEHHLMRLSVIYPGLTWSRATFGPAYVERTATEIWRCLATLRTAPLLWNVFPLHPHEAGQPFTNRKFTARELATVQALNAELFDWLNIRQVIALGRDASQYAATFGLPVHQVRHPSYGGTTEFRASIREIYGIPDRQADLLTDATVR